MGGAALGASTGFQVLGGGVAAMSSYNQGKASQQYYDYLGDTSLQNAALARTVANTRNKEINTEAGMAERNLSDKLNVTEGAQKTAVSMGAGLGSRTAQSVIADTLQKGNLDEMAIRYNTAMKSKSVTDQGAMEAFNDENQARGYKVAGNDAMTAGRMGMITSILGTGSSVSSNWVRYNWPNG